MNKQYDLEERTFEFARQVRILITSPTPFAKCYHRRVTRRPSTVSIGKRANTGPEKPQISGGRYELLNLKEGVVFEIKGNCLGNKELRCFLTFFVGSHQERNGVEEILSAIIRNSENDKP